MQYTSPMIRSIKSIGRFFLWELFKYLWMRASNISMSNLLNWCSFWANKENGGWIWPINLHINLGLSFFTYILFVCVQRLSWRVEVEVILTLWRIYPSSSTPTPPRKKRVYCPIRRACNPQSYVLRIFCLENGAFKYIEAIIYRMSLRVEISK